jgi:predicted phosphodiesterase
MRHGVCMTLDSARFWINNFIEKSNYHEFAFCDIYESYCFWCSGEGVNVIHKSTLGKALAEAGFSKRESHGQSIWRLRLIQQEPQKQEKPQKLKDPREPFALIADTHFGSKTCAEQEFREFVYYSYHLGVRKIFHAGDIFDGCYHRGHAYELKQHSYQDQRQTALDAMPELPGMNYYMITGNHDYNSFFKAVGMDPGAGLEEAALRDGRTDIHYCGYLQARFLLTSGNEELKLELVHPQSGPSYAKSYPVQKWIERGYEGGDKPHIICMGHHHTYSVIEVRNVLAIQPGCWQWQTPYMQAKGLMPAVGGVIVWAENDSDGLRVKTEWRRWWPRGTHWEKV